MLFILYYSTMLIILTIIIGFIALVQFETQEFIPYEMEEPMPLYSLKCTNCNHEFETFAPVAERHNQKCEKCGSQTEIQISAITTSWRCECPTASGGKPTS